MRLGLRASLSILRRCLTQLIAAKVTAFHMPDTIHQQFSFEPVGQGLFAHGYLQRDGEKSRFVWVYDCGTSSPFSSLQNRIDLFANFLGGGEIDLLILSHYDQDHVNGVVELVRNSRVRTLVIPYLYPAQRLILMTQAVGTANWYQRFLASPANYLLESGADRIERIVMIEPGGEPPPEAPEAGDGERPDWPSKALVKDRRRNQTNSGSPVEGFEPDNDWDLNDGRIAMVDSNKPLTVLGRWEFCFWNRPQNPDDLKAWWETAEPAWRRFQSGEKTPWDYRVLIADMRHALTTNPRLPKTAFNANEISLQCYNGPLRRNLDPSATSRSHVEHVWVEDQWDWWPDYEMLSPWNRIRPSIPYDGGFLFTGDITMDSKLSGQLELFLGRRRWQSLAYLQVPHHGARRSWRNGVYSTWMHRFSVFSAAGPYVGYGHPHKEVVEDLENHGPIHVDLNHGLTGGGYFHFQ